MANVYYLYDLLKYKNKHPSQFDKNIQSMIINFELFTVKQ